MSNRQFLFKAFRAVGLMLSVGMSMSVCAIGGSVNWKEEVLLHDGKKLIVERSHTYGGYGEIGQGRLIAESTTTFTIPGTYQTVTWKSDYGRGNEDNLDLLILDFMDGIPYIATSPAFCHAYNKWGRPNPPYVFFNYDGETWKRIPLEELPSEFKEANVVINTKADEKYLTSTPVSSEQIKELNSSIKEFSHPLARTPIKNETTVGCGELVYYKGAWVGPGNSVGRRMMDRKSKYGSHNIKEK